MVLGTNQMEKMVTGREESKNSMVQSLDAKESHVCKSKDSWGWLDICFGLEHVCTQYFSTPSSLTLYVHSQYLSVHLTSLARKLPESRNLASLFTAKHPIVEQCLAGTTFSV